MQKTYYQILGVSVDSNADQIIAAHMRAVARLMESGIHDPDSNALLDTALETLTDDTARAAYDAALKEAEATPRLSAVRAKAPEESVDDSQGSGRAMSRTTKSTLAFMVAALLTSMVGWLLLKSVPPPTPSIAPIVQTTAPVEDKSNPPPATTTETRADAGKPVDPRPRTAEQVFSDVSHSVVKVIVADASGNSVGSGSGVVTARQTVITNCHVVTKGQLITVKTIKDSYSANISVADEVYDLCQLDVAGLNAPAVEIGTIQYVRTGQKVFAVGAPQGLELTISEGIVSSLRETALGNIIQTTAAISPGSSGGGLFNVNAQLIGITTFQHKTGQNLNFAVPADWIASMSTRSGSGPIPN
jgi:S1-C subfamily serine protease